MGFAAEVRHITQFMASCNEPPCHWVGPMRDMHQHAEDDAAKHVELHYEAWSTYQKAIEEAPEGAIVEYYDDLTYPAIPRSYHPYTGDSPRFAYTALPSLDLEEVDAG